MEPEPMPHIVQQDILLDDIKEYRKMNWINVSFT